MAATLPHLGGRVCANYIKIQYSQNAYRTIQTRLFTNIPITVVRSRPDSEYRLVEVPFTALHDELMSSTDHLDIIRGTELHTRDKTEQLSEHTLDSEIITNEGTQE